MARVSRISEERLAALYDSEGGEKSMLARVIRELIDEIRVLRDELAQVGSRESMARPDS